MTHTPGRRRRLSRAVAGAWARRAVRAGVFAAAALVALIASAALPGLAAAATATPVTTTTSTETPADSPPVELTVFWGDGCPKCKEMREWLPELATTMPNVTVTQHEVWLDAANRDLFVRTGRDLGFEASAVPTTIVGERVWIGYTDQIRDDITRQLERASAGQSIPRGIYGTPGTGTCSQEELACEAPGDERIVIDVPLVGEVDLGGRSLVATTLIIGFVDGINPCSLWAISVLLTIVVRTASRRRVVAVGSTFLLVTAAMYALFMAGIYTALTFVGYLGWIQLVVGLVAGVFGLVAVKDYFAFKQGPSFGIKDSAKPGLYRRMREAAGHHSLLPALLATTGLAVVVSLLETPCTAGFPMLWTGLLQVNGVGFAEAAGLFVLYMVPFLLDEFIVFGIAVATMRAMKMQEKHGEALKLVAGVTMLALAAVMIVDPGLMENPLVALTLFAAAFAAAAVIHLVTTRLRRSTVSAGSGTLGT